MRIKLLVAALAITAMVGASWAGLQQANTKVTAEETVEPSPDATLSGCRVCVGSVLGTPVATTGRATKKENNLTIQRMDHVGVVIDDLEPKSPQPTTDQRAVAQRARPDDPR
jgi:hypothetical protein